MNSNNQAQATVRCHDGALRCEVTVGRWRAMLLLLAVNISSVSAFAQPRNSVRQGVQSVLYQSCGPLALHDGQAQTAAYIAVFSKDRLRNTGDLTVDCAERISANLCTQAVIGVLPSLHFANVTARFFTRDDWIAVGLDVAGWMDRTPSSTMPSAFPVGPLEQHAVAQVQGQRAGLVGGFAGAYAGSRMHGNGRLQSALRGGIGALTGRTVGGLAGMGTKSAGMAGAAGGAAGGAVTGGGLSGMGVGGAVGYGAAAMFPVPPAKVANDPKVRLARCLDMRQQLDRLTASLATGSLVNIQTVDEWRRLIRRSGLDANALAILEEAGRTQAAMILEARRQMI